MLENQKRCIKCIETKEISMFRKTRNMCRECDRLYNIEYKRTKKGLITKIYNSQVSKCKKRGVEPPEYSRNELIDRFIYTDNFIKLYDNWVDSNYLKDNIPSFDRLDNSLTYSFSNIKLTTWKENQNNYYRDLSIGINSVNRGFILDNISVVQYDMHGIFIVEYNSIANASRSSKVRSGDIISCCKNKRNSAGGFKWKYKESK